MRFQYIYQKWLSIFLLGLIISSTLFSNEDSARGYLTGEFPRSSRAIMSSDIPGYGFRHPFVAYKRGKHLRQEDSLVWTEERTVSQLEDNEEFLLVEASLKEDFLQMFPHAAEGWSQKVLTENGEIEAIHFAANIPVGFAYKTRRTIKIVNHWYELLATPRHLYHIGPWMNIGETYLELEVPLGLEYLFSIEKKYFEKTDN
tara:strand:- start:24 stop:626 length:603 start_codon:yes stop_codon:yes gene_type:complete